MGPSLYRRCAGVVPGPRPKNTYTAAARKQPRWPRRRGPRQRRAEPFLRLALGATARARGGKTMNQSCAGSEIRPSCPEWPRNPGADRDVPARRRRKPFAPFARVTCPSAGNASAVPASLQGDRPAHMSSRPNPGRRRLDVLLDLELPLTANEPSFSAPSSSPYGGPKPADRPPLCAPYGSATADTSNGSPNRALCDGRISLAPRLLFAELYRTASRASGGLARPRGGSPPVSRAWKSSAPQSVIRPVAG